MYYCSSGWSAPPMFTTFYKLDVTSVVIANAAAKDLDCVMMIDFHIRAYLQAYPQLAPGCLSECTGWMSATLLVLIRGVWVQ